jgi:hypothetical protein
MTPFLPANLGLHHVRAIVRAMWEVATADGVHDTERVMVRGFYESCQQDTPSLSSFDELVGGEFDFVAAAESFDNVDLKHALLKSCILLAYADGQYSHGEQTKVQEYAKLLGVTPPDLQGMESAVADHLIQQISRIQNTDALQTVAAEVAKR